MENVNQEYIDNLNLLIADKKTDLAGIVCECIMGADIGLNKLIMQLMTVQVLSTCIRHYDINFDIFTKNEILLIEEKLMIALQTCPNY